MIMTGREAVGREQFFQLSACDHNLRGHRHIKLSKQRASLYSMQNVFSTVACNALRTDALWCKHGLAIAEVQY